MDKGHIVYHFKSVVTGEIVPGLREVIHVIWTGWKHYKLVNLKWQYSKQGW